MAVYPLAHHESALYYVQDVPNRLEQLEELAKLIPVIGSKQVISW